jgi:NADPH-dependent 2,4-dienoyl-CoA reductase/sulfur reductase-like enzyme
MKGSGATTSVWMATSQIGARPALGKDIAADVCVVGAGIAGLTTAYLLAEEGRSVVVLDDGPIARRRNLANDGAPGQRAR